MCVTIRDAVRADLPSLAELYRQLQPDDSTTPAVIECGFFAMQAQPGCRVFIAEHEDEIVGTFILYLLPNMTRNGRPAAVLENIVVDVRYRGHGIGREILAYARELARMHGCYKLSLTSNASRVDAHAFYRRCGMMQHGVSFRYVL